MPETTTFDTRRLRPLHGSSYVIAGVVAILALTALAAAVLIYNLPSASAFNEQVERLFVASEGLTEPDEIRLLEILAQSGTAFSETLASYRYVILVLMVFSVALLLAACGFLLNTVTLGRRMSELERAGMHVTSLVVSREEQTVYLNDLEFELTPAAMETMAVLCEARLDDEILTGARIESLVSGKDHDDCEEAAGATRIKRLRDALGNQLVSELLVKNITRSGYVLSIDKDAIRLL